MPQSLPPGSRRSGATNKVLDQYTHLMQLDHPDFVWMNYGLACHDYSWIRSDLDKRWKFQVSLARFTVRGVDISGARVLDTGSGRGGNCSYLVRYHQPKQVIGLDQSALQVNWCNKRFKDEGINFVAGDAQDIPFPDEAFDVVTNIESACHYPDKSRFYAQVRRVLAPRGYFCHSCNYANVPYIENELQRAGFAILEREDITERVIRALVENDENFRLLLTQIAGTPAAMTFAMGLHTTLTHHIPKVFTSEHRYMSWVLRKVS